MISATLRLHIGWLEAQLAETPADDHARGRYDALCDLLARVEVVGV